MPPLFFIHRNRRIYGTTTHIKHPQTPSPWWCHVTLQRHGYGKSANTLVVASSEGGGGQGRGGRILFNYVNRPRKNLLVNSTYYFIFSNILPLNHCQNNSSHPPLSPTLFTPLLCTIIKCRGIVLVGCCMVIF
jgi:hypothetical protein